MRWRTLALRYGQWRARRSLDGVYVRGLDRARQAVRDGPVTFAATHVAWWDGVLMVLLDDALGIESRFLIDAANLRRIPWATAIGGIALDRSSPVSPRRGLITARAHLSGPGDAVWIFPQGRQRPRHVRPLGLQPGIEFLHRRRAGVVIPVTLGYGFRESHLPTAVVTFEAPMEPGFTQSMLEHALVGGVAVADRFLDGDTEGFHEVLPPRRRNIDAGLGARALRWVSGG